MLTNLKIQNYRGISTLELPHLSQVNIFIGKNGTHKTSLLECAALVSSLSPPLNLLGDGFCRLVLMLTGVFTSKASTLIVDELDSGLHYSAMEPIWSNLLSLTTKNKKQLFCVTHNEEMLQATIDTFAAEPQALSVYGLSTQENGEVKAQYYDYELLKDSFTLDFEVR